MGQYGEAQLTVDLQSINLLKPYYVNNYYFYYLNKHFLNRIKHSNRHRKQLLGSLLTSPNSKSLELVDIYKRFKQLKTYPKEQVINGNYILDIIDTDLYINNIINSIPILVNNLPNDIIERKTMVKAEYINIYEDSRFHNLVDNYMFISFNPNIPFNSIQSFPNRLFLNLNDTDEVSLFFRDYIFTYLFQNFSYTDKTFNEPLNINNKDYYINTNEDYEFIIKVKKTLNRVETTDGNGNAITTEVINGNNEYYIRLKSTEENNKEYLDLSILIQVPISIVLPYSLEKDNTEFKFTNKIIGINIEYLFEYINKNDEIIKTKTIPLTFILDNNTINNIEENIINPSLIYPISDEDKNNIDLNTIINNLKISMSNFYITKQITNTDSNLYTLPNINLLNISYATLDAKLDINGSLKKQTNIIHHKCYPVEYYQPAYDEGELKPNFRGTGWKDIRLYGDTSNLNGEAFIEARKKDEKIILQSLSKLGFNLDTFAFNAYRKNISYYDEQGVKRTIQKFPFRNIFDKDKVVKIANEGEPVYYSHNSSALFYGIEFNVSVHNGKNDKAMLLGEIAYVYYFFETILTNIYNTKELTHLDSVSNISFSNYYGTYKNNVDRSIGIINCTYYKYDKNSLEYNDIKNKIKNKKYYIELLTNNTGKVYKLTSNTVIECISFNISYNNKIKLNFDNIKIVKDIITKPIKTNDIYASVNNISLLADNMQEGVQLPINIEAYTKVPPIIRTDVYINSIKLALYNMGMGAIVKQEEWVIGLTIAANVLALILSIVLTIIFPPAGVAGITGSVVGIIGSAGGLITSILFQTGVIDTKTSMVLSLIFGVISLGGSITALASGIANSALTALEITTKIIQSIDQTTQIAIQSYDVYNYERTQRLEKEKKEFINNVSYIEDNHNKILDMYKKENYMNIQDLMDIYYGNPSYTTPTQFYKITKTIGFDYNQLYKAPEDISNYVNNCLRLK